jgi:hypothetical protein
MATYPRDINGQDYLLLMEKQLEIGIKTKKKRYI